MSEPRPETYDAYLQMERSIDHVGTDPDLEYEPFEPSMKGIDFATRERAVHELGLYFVRSRKDGSLVVMVMERGAYFFVDPDLRDLDLVHHAIEEFDRLVDGP